MSPSDSAIVVVLLFVAWFLLSHWKSVLLFSAAVLIAVFMFGAFELMAQLSL